jgi:glycosyltransferase involved in cell wall biosynthesis
METSSERIIKVAILTPDLSSGGAERIAWNLSKYLAARNYTVELVTIHPEHNVTAAPGVSHQAMSVSRLRNSILPWIKYLYREKPDLVISVLRSTNIVAGIGAYLSPSHKLVFREANTFDGIATLSILLSKAYRVLLRISYRSAHAVIANSIDTESSLIDQNIVEYQKIHRIPNPVLPENYTDLQNQNIKHKWFDSSDNVLFLSVGRLHRQKNYKHLLRAFCTIYRRHPNARLIIIGRGNEYQELMQFIYENNLSSVVDIITRYVNPHPYFKAADFFLLTSSWEGFGNVLVEALAADTEIISSNCPGGPNEILQDGKYGVMYEAGCDSALVDAVSSLLSSPKKTPGLVRRANDYTVSSIGARYEQVLRATLGYRDV